MNNNKLTLFIISIFILNTNLLSNNHKDLISYLTNSNLHKLQTWKALLHVRNNQAQINDATFLLSHDNFSLKNELILTVKQFQNKKLICKYPARYYWLSNKLLKSNFKLPYKYCKDFENYKKQTNAQSIDLVFVSENTNSPSSMMGHTFFKLNGIKNGQVRENAISFFTEINTINIPLLIAQSTVLGMKGYFVLSPYKKQIFSYINNEKRNIWEFKLNLNKNELNLIYYHFWELKSVNMTYYFTGFNCATIVDDILALQNKAYKRDEFLWITPKDVIKKANKYKLINSTKLIPSIQWKLKMLDDEIKEKKLSSFINILKKNDINMLKKLLNNNSLDSIDKEFILTYAKYLYISSEKLSYNNYKKITNLFNIKKIPKLEINNFKNPINTFNDTQASISYDKNKQLYFSFLPTSNTIFDDNRNYFAESSLKILEISLKIVKNNISLNYFNLYEMQSLIPYKKTTNDLSKEFLLSYQDTYNIDLNKEKRVVLNGGIGISKQFFNDMFIYALVKLNVNTNIKNSNALISSKFGLNIYELFNMKSVLTHEIYQDLNSKKFNYKNTNFNQSIFIKKDYRIDLNINRIENNTIKKDNFLIRFNLFF